MKKGGVLFVCSVLLIGMCSKEAGVESGHASIRGAITGVWLYANGNHAFILLHLLDTILEVSADSALHVDAATEDTTYLQGIVRISFEKRFAMAIYSCVDSACSLDVTLLHVPVLCRTGELVENPVGLSFPYCPVLLSQCLSDPRAEQHEVAGEYVQKGDSLAFYGVVGSDTAIAALERWGTDSLRIRIEKDFLCLDCYGADCPFIDTGWMYFERQEDEYDKYLSGEPGRIDGNYYRLVSHNGQYRLERCDDLVSCGG